MARMKEVLVSYDIQSNKIRNRLITQLKDVGLISVQKSVMWGRLIPAEVKLVKRLLTHEIDLDTDKAFVMVSKLTENANFYGIKPNFEEYDGHGIY